MPWVGLQCVIVVFPDHTYLLFSILGPLLALIFINDLSIFIRDSIQTVDFYADYTTLYDTGLDIDMLENNLQHSLNLL